NGMALGGVDTGCIDLETSGLLGYCTIFNTHVPRRGPINLPILGMSVGGKTWVLCEKQPKQGWGGCQVPVEPVFTDLKLDGVQTAKEIHYWGHYPVADLEFETDAPVSVGMRAWSPFLPGAVVDSMTPGIVFEVHLRNTSTSAQKGTIAFSFPGPTKKEAGSEEFSRQILKDSFKGVAVSGKDASYSLGVVGKLSPRLGGELGADGASWAGIADKLPQATVDQPGSSVAVDFRLGSGEEKIVRFVLTWYAPTWNGGGYNWANWNHSFTHMYAKHYPDAANTARLLAKNHESLLKRTLAWQQVIYTENKLPVWLRDSLINSLYLITEDGMWAQKKAPLPRWVREDDGLFGLNECPRGCAQIECIPCSFYGNIPLVYFFPELALSTLRGYQGYQYSDGCPPWTFTGFNGGKVEFADATRGYQWASNGISLASLVHRFLMCDDTPDKKYLKEFYPMVKKCMIWTVGLRTTPSYTIGEKVISMPDADSPEQVKPPTEWFEAGEPGWLGMTAHIAGLHLAQLRITEKMAEEIGDVEFANQCAEWIKAGAEAMEKRLWDQRGYYLNYFEPDSNRKSEFVFGYQLDGEWITDHHGLESALPRERVKTVLDTVKRCNVAVTKYGAVNYANPDGTVANPGGYGAYSYFPPEALMLAMNYIYEGQKEYGVELARKVWHNLFCLQGYTWDMPNIMRGDVDTGERTFGNDYYQDMMLWSLPAALEDKPLDAPCKPNGLVNRVIRAAAKK
ncbi:MAG: GH116 family glycosyl hydrolase, partial [Armatimonadota bacterium]